MSLRLRPLTREEHLAFIKSRSSASFLQCPSWADVKAEWTSQSVGWVDATDKVVGAGLILFRQIPKVKKYLAYLPEGPVLDWESIDLAEWLEPMIEYLGEQGAFAVKMGPQVTLRSWGADTIKRAIAGGQAQRLRDVRADHTNIRGMEIAHQLRAMGWLQEESEDAGFGDFQPRYVFQVPLAGRSIDDVHSGFNQLWRRNIKKAMKGGVEVVRGDYEDLDQFHQVYVVTAERDGFTPRSLPYFQRMWQALAAEDPNRIRLYFADHGEETLAATLMVTVGEHVWYSYGASANHKRELRPSNAIQWKMLQDAYTLGGSVYDLRGISDTLEESHKLFGLIQFKLGTGGQAVEYLGEWDYPINKLIYKAFDLYMSRR